MQCQCFAVASLSLDGTTSTSNTIQFHSKISLRVSNTQYLAGIVANANDQKSRSSTIPSPFFGAQKQLILAAPSVPGISTSPPNTLSKRQGRMLSAVWAMPLRVRESPWFCGTLVGSRAKRKSALARSGPNTCCAADIVQQCQTPFPSSANARFLSGRDSMSMADMALVVGRLPTTCWELRPRSSLTSMAE